MKLSGTRALPMILLIAVLSEAGCGNNPEVETTADTGKTEISSTKPSPPPPSGAKGVDTEKLAPETGGQTCLSLKSTAPERIQQLFKDAEELQPVEVTSGGVNWGTACRYWEKNKRNLHQIFIKTNATADSFKKMKKQTVDAQPSLKPVDAQNPAFDDLFFFEFKSRWFTQVTIHARKGKNQLVTTALASREDLIKFAKDVFAELE